jgi:transposase
LPRLGEADVREAGDGGGAGGAHEATPMKARRLARGHGLTFPSVRRLWQLRCSLAGVLRAGCDPGRQNARQVPEALSILVALVPFSSGFRRMEVMTKHRSHSAAFKRQLAEEFTAGETLHALAQRHDISRRLVRIWVGKFEAGALDGDAQAADLLQEYEAKIAALEGMVGRQALEIELPKGAARHAPRPRSASTSVVTGPVATPASLATTPRRGGSRASIPSAMAAMAGLRCRGVARDRRPAHRPVGGRDLLGHLPPEPGEARPDARNHRNPTGGDTPAPYPTSGCAMWPTEPLLPITVRVAPERQKFSQLKELAEGMGFEPTIGLDIL